MSKLRILAKNNFYFFCRAILDFNYMEPKAHLGLCKFMQRPSRWKSIVMPRGFLKTTICSKGYLLWRIMKNRDIRILIAQCIFGTASQTLVGARSHIEHNRLLQAVAPWIVPPNFQKAGTWSSESFTVPRDKIGMSEATVQVAGSGTKVTGQHYDIIDEDDLLAPSKDSRTGEELMPTADEVEKSIMWHTTNIPTIMISPGEGECLNVGTRWGYRDLIWYIRERQNHLFSDENCFTLDVEDANGNPTHPKRFGHKVIAEIQSIMTPYLFNSLYHGRPVPMEEQRFSREDIEGSMFEMLPDRPMSFAVYVDPAISEAKRACDSVVMCVGTDEDGHRWVDAYEAGHYNPTETINHCLSYAEKRKVKIITIESVGYQKSLCHFMEKEIKKRGMNVWVRPHPRGGNNAKFAAIDGLQPFFSEGTVHVRHGMKKLLQQLLDYPFGLRVDVIDCLSFSNRYLAEGTPQTIKHEPLPDPNELSEILRNIRKQHNKGNEDFGFGEDFVPNEVADNDREYVGMQY